MRKPRDFLKNRIQLDTRKKSGGVRSNCQGAQAQGHRESWWRCLQVLSCRTCPGLWMRPSRGQGLSPCPVLIGRSATGSCEINGRTASSQVFSVQMWGSPTSWLLAYPYSLQGAAVSPSPTGDLYWGSAVPGWEPWHPNAPWSSL